MAGGSVFDDDKNALLNDPATSSLTVLCCKGSNFLAMNNIVRISAYFFKLCIPNCTITGAEESPGLYYLPYPSRNSRTTDLTERRGIRVYLPENHSEHYGSLSSIVVEQLSIEV